MKLKVCFAAVAASLASLVEADNWMIDAACTAGEILSEVLHITDRGTKFTSSAQSAYLQQALANASKSRPTSTASDGGVQTL